MGRVSIVALRRNFSVPALRLNMYHFQIASSFSAAAKAKILPWTVREQA